MASGAFFNPRSLLLLTPLVSSTCTLWFSRDQEFFLRIFTSRIDKEQANDILPSYITARFYRATSVVVGVVGVTFCSSLAGIWLYRPILQSRGSLRWYALTATLALGHLAWVPAVAWKLKTVMDDTPEEQGTTNVAVMTRWLQVNLTRMLTTDLSAWLCAVAAITTTFRV